jgi:transcriptional regulator with XRE-family HTH domain
VVLGDAIGKTSGMHQPIQKQDVQLQFAANMRRIRLEKQMTQENVAEAAGLHPNYISSVERGERNISLWNIARIAGALDYSMSELLTDSHSRL